MTSYFLYYFSFLPLVFFFIHMFFLSFFSLIFSPPHTYTYPYLYLHSFFWLFVFLVLELQTLDHISTSPSLFLSLSLTHTHTHTNFSPSISHKQILSHTYIDHRQRSGDRRSMCFFFFGFGLISFILLFRFH